jgi:hypothetical protein
MIPDRLLSRLTQISGARSLWQRFPIGSVATRVRYGIFDRPHYAYRVYWASDLAKRPGLNAIQVIEFGVAGGNGLLALERIAAVVSADLGIEINVCGFEGGGMAPPGYYAMDVPMFRHTRVDPSAGAQYRQKPLRQ